MGETIIKRQRNSSIELLKLIAIFLIIVNHVTMDFCDYSKTIYTYGIASKSIENIILNTNIYFGSIGNAIFLVASIWFLCDDKKLNTKKIWKLLCDNWIISVTFLLFFVFIGYHIGINEVLSSLFPTYLCNYWFVTCYIMMYTIHTLLNTLIDNLNKKQLLIVCSVLFIIYLLASNIVAFAYYNSFTIFIVYYFVISYIKKYLYDFTRDNKRLLAIGIVSLCLLLCLILLTNYLGLTISFLNDKVLHWDDIKNPLIFLLSFSLFCLFKNMNFESKIINSISSLSLLVYIIHDNELFCLFTRKKIIHFLAERMPISNVVFKILVISLLFYVVSIIVSFIYMKLANKSINKVSNKIDSSVNNLVNRLISKIDN